MYHGWILQQLLLVFWGFFSQSENNNCKNTNFNSLNHARRFSSSQSKKFCFRVRVNERFFLLITLVPCEVENVFTHNSYEREARVDAFLNKGGGVRKYGMVWTIYGISWITYISKILITKANTQHCIFPNNTFVVVKFGL